MIRGRLAILIICKSLACVALTLRGATVSVCVSVLTDPKCSVCVAEVVVVCGRVGLSCAAAVPSRTRRSNGSKPRLGKLRSRFT